MLQDADASTVKLVVELVGRTKSGALVRSRISSPLASVCMGKGYPCRTQLHDSLDGADKHCSRTVRPSASIGETRGVVGGR